MFNAHTMWCAVSLHCHRNNKDATYPVMFVMSIALPIQMTEIMYEQTVGSPTHFTADSPECLAAQQDMFKLLCFKAEVVNIYSLISV